VCCNVLQRGVGMLQHVAGVLQCAAACYSVFRKHTHCRRTNLSFSEGRKCSALQCVAVCCRCVALCCSALQVRSIVLQCVEKEQNTVGDDAHELELLRGRQVKCVAVCCSVLQCATSCEQNKRTVSDDAHELELLRGPYTRIDTNPGRKEREHKYQRQVKSSQTLCVRVYVSVREIYL